MGESHFQLVYINNNWYFVDTLELEIMTVEDFVNELLEATPKSEYMQDWLTEYYNKFLQVKKVGNVIFTMENAKEVADYDYRVGISTAIQYLNDIGIETPYYWKMLNENIENPDFDWININARDKQFEILGIKEMLDIAYDIIWK